MLPIGHQRLIIGVSQFEEMCKIVAHLRANSTITYMLLARVYVLFTEVFKLKYMYDNYISVPKKACEFYINGEPLSLLTALQPLRRSLSISDSGIVTIIRARNNYVHDVLNNRERALLCCNVLYTNRMYFMKFYNTVINDVNVDGFEIRTSYFPYVLSKVVQIMKSHTKDKDIARANILSKTESKLQTAIDWLNSECTKRT